MGVSTAGAPGAWPPPDKKDLPMTETPRKSNFVSILAWVFIALSAGATALSALQNLMLYLVFPRAEMKAALESGARVEHIPWVARVMMSNFELFVGAFLFLAVLMLIVSIGLLRRWNWARRLIIIFMGLGILWNLVGIAVQYWLFAEPTVDVAPEFAAGMQTLLIVLRVFTAIVALVMSGLMAWVMWRLTRPAVAAEFGVLPATPLPAAATAPAAPEERPPG